MMCGSIPLRDVSEGGGCPMSCELHDECLCRLKTYIADDMSIKQCIRDYCSEGIYRNNWDTRTVEQKLTKMRLEDQHPGVPPPYD